METFDLKIKKDFDWVYQILKSCETIDHFQVADECLRAWENKWNYLCKDRIYDIQLSYFKGKYEQYKDKKRNMGFKL